MGKNKTTYMKVEISIGELLDKLSILYIKRKFISDPEKIQNVQKEIDVLEPLSNNFLTSSEIRTIFDELEHTNLHLWNVEDLIREKENRKEFDQDFIDLARSVYITNDQRASLKKKINFITGSNLVEEKSYQEYK
jgi:hypothetical protein